MRISIKIKVFSLINLTLIIFAFIFWVIITFFSYNFFLMKYKSELKNEYQTFLKKSLNTDNYLKLIKPSDVRPPLFFRIIDSQGKIHSSNAANFQKEKILPKEIHYKITSIKKNNFDFFTFTPNDSPEEILVLLGKLPHNLFVIIERPLGSIREAIILAKKVILITEIISFIISIIMSYFFSYLLTKPIFTLRRVVHSITKLNFNDIANISNNDEIGDLGKDINRISEKLKDTIADLENKNILLENDKKQLLEFNLKLEKISETDTLTQLSNRLKIDKVLEKFSNISKKEGRTFSIIIFDIDHFKKINDTYGHPIGDIVLKNISKLIKDNFRNNDEIGRWGGEEFIAILPNTVIKDAKIKAETLRQLIENSVFEPVPKVTCSFGISEFRTSDDVNSAIKRADDRLYRAKKNGRNQVVFD